MTPELNSLLALHTAVRMVFATDGSGRLTQQAGDPPAPEFGVDVDVLAGSVGAFAQRHCGGSKVFVLVCEQGLVVGRRRDNCGGTIGAVAGDVGALGLLIHHIGKMADPESSEVPAS